MNSRLLKLGKPNKHHMPAIPRVCLGLLYSLVLLLYIALLLKANQSVDLTCSLRNVTQLTNTIRKLRRPITGSSAQCSHHCMSSLQLLTSWTRDVDHRADTGFCWTGHSKHDCRTRDRCKVNSDNVVLTILLFEMFMCYVQGGVCAMVSRNLLW